LECQDKIAIAKPSEWVKCNLCGSDNTVAIFEERGFNIVKCKICGLVYVNPRLKDEDRLSIYQDVTKAEAQWHKRLQIITGKRVVPPARLPDSDLVDELNKYYQITLDRIEHITHKKNGRILDIGCGPGLWIYYAKLHGWDAYGFEITKPRESIVKDLIKDNILVGERLEEVGFPKKSFDIVTLWHVLEHIPDPAKCLGSVKELMKDDGLMIVAVPNYHWIRFKAWIMKHIISEDYYLSSPHFNKWGYFFPEEHLYNFSLKTLEAYFKKYDLKIKKVFIDWPVQKKSYLSECIYIILVLISRLVNFMTRSRINIYINLTLYAENIPPGEKNS